MFFYHTGRKRTEGGTRSGTFQEFFSFLSSIDLSHSFVCTVYGCNLLSSAFYKRKDGNTALIGLNLIEIIND